MGKINPPVSNSGPGGNSHRNWMDGTSWDVNDPIKRLRMAAASCFFGEPMYYHRDAEEAKQAPKVRRLSSLTDADVRHLREVLDAKDPQEWRKLAPKEMLEKAIDEALAHDLYATLDVAVRLRQEDNIRVTPQVIFVRAAHMAQAKGPKVTPAGMRTSPNRMLTFAQKILHRADEPATQLAYHLTAYGKDTPIPNVLKKAWKAALERCDDYRLAKYRLEGNFVKTRDVARLVHAKSESVDRLCKGTLRNTGQTWEAIISEQGAEAEKLRISGKTAEASLLMTTAWRGSIQKMHHMALLRNLRNLITNKIDQAEYMPRLLATVKQGRQLPFRYYSAYLAVKGSGAPPQVLDGIEKALVMSLENVPKFPGRVMSLCDNSGSARGATSSSMGTVRVASIGNLTGVITGMNSDEGYLGVFGDRLEVLPVRKSSSVFDQLLKADDLGNRDPGGTENGVWLFWDNAIKKKEHWDSVFVYSDMQAGHGGLYGTDAKAYAKYQWVGRGSSHQYIDVPSLIRDYRRKVNRDVNVYLVQIAGYQDTIVPEYYDRTYILGGWGDGLLRFAAAMSGVPHQEAAPEEEEEPHQ